MFVQCLALNKQEQLSKPVLRLLSAAATAAEKSHVCDITHRYK